MGPELLLPLLRLLLFLFVLRLLLLCRELERLDRERLPEVLEERRVDPFEDDDRELPPEERLLPPEERLLAPLEERLPPLERAELG